jgi:hypothetical protein
MRTTWCFEACSARVNYINKSIRHQDFCELLNIENNKEILCHKPFFDASACSD